MSANFKRHISRNQIFLVSKTPFKSVSMFAKLLSTFWKSFLWVRSEKRPEKSAETAWLLWEVFKIRISLLDQSQNLSSDRSFCSGAGGCIFIQMLLCSKRRLMDQKCQTEACRFFNQFSSYSCFFILYLSQSLKGCDFQIFFDGSKILKKINQVAMACYSAWWNAI